MVRGFDLRSAARLYSRTCAGPCMSLSTCSCAFPPCVLQWTVWQAVSCSCQTCGMGCQGTWSVGSSLLHQLLSGQACTPQAVWAS
jgi:hypothetical protein